MKYCIEYHTNSQLGTDDRNIAIYDTLEKAMEVAEEIRKVSNIIVEIRSYDESRNNKTTGKSERTCQK